MSEKVASPNGSSAAQLRKIKKPIIERRRRERINDSLNQLKALVLDALNKDESRYSKMEKADILEMTVKHLKAVQRQFPSHVTHTNEVDTRAQEINRYQAGYQECAQEVTSYLGGVQGLNGEVQARLMQHLFKKMSQSSTAANPTPGGTPLTALPGTALSLNIPQSSEAAHFVTPQSIQLLPNAGTGQLTVNPSVIAVLSPATLPQGTVLNNTVPLCVKPVISNLSSASSPSSEPLGPSVISPTGGGSVGSSPVGAGPAGISQARVRGVMSPQLGDDAPSPDMHSQLSYLPQTAVSPLSPSSTNHVTKYPANTHMKSSSLAHKDSTPCLKIDQTDEPKNYSMKDMQSLANNGCKKKPVKSQLRDTAAACSDSSHFAKKMLTSSQMNDLCQPSSDLGYGMKSVWRPW